jgi:hypothetical protein
MLESINPGFDGKDIGRISAPILNCYPWGGRDDPIRSPACAGGPGDTPLQN